MPRLIKRYGSRKLYDTTDSRYVGLDDIAAFVRAGEDVRVVDNKSGTDVTAAILTQVISEEGRDGRGLLSPGFLHDLLRVGERTLRRGEEAVGSAVEAGLTVARQGVDEIARAAAERIRPSGHIADVRDEMDRLRERLESLESTLDALDASATAPEPASKRAPRRASKTP
ncbi:MAG TPA: polyhydroxyalkanoate synthesis regulator DNA-binding domain-containing protein [Rubricoccaceae bacterium]|jgi:polyhydroxyalkanoate synthesis repressor PhaR